MPTVGNDWYPVVIDSYTTAEYADLDAYLASEYGLELLPGCGCSAVVPLATATQLLAENGINITVRDQPGLFKRNNGGNNGLLVDKKGQAVYFMGGSTQYVCLYATDNPSEMDPTSSSSAAAADLVNSFGLGTQLANIPGEGVPIVIDGITYQVHEVGNGFSLSPDPPAW